MKYRYFVLGGGMLLIGLIVATHAYATSTSALATRLSGRILLQVEGHGEAWYVHPVDHKRIYLKDGATAYEIMRTEGLGITNADIAKIPVGTDSTAGTDTDGDGLSDSLEGALGTNPTLADSDTDGHADGAEVQNGYSPLGPEKTITDLALVNRLKGRIVLQVQSQGRAWYINPTNGKRYYLKDGADAYRLMRTFGLGITTKDLGTISERSIASTEPTKNLKKFVSVAAFDTYIQNLQKKEEAEKAAQKTNSNSSGVQIDFPSDFAGFSEQSLASPAAESITNTQEVGVDEGDIVKAYGKYLVVLRRGRLFTIRLEDQNQPILTPVAKLDVLPAGLGAGYGVWYDEMLIYKNKVIVIGYRYDEKATEINRFSINDAGNLTHLSTHLIDSEDYYSSRNFASRLVDNKLIIYMPTYLYRTLYTDKGSERSIHLPEIRKWMGAENFSTGTPILKPTDIYQPIQETYTPALHTIATCDLDAVDFTCTAKAILGPYTRTFYVSPSAVYLWVGGREGYSWYATPKIMPPYSDNAYVYRFPLSGTAASSVIADGVPLDQFSFKEQGNNLYVLVRDDGYGDAMWRPGKGSGDLGLVNIPLSSFSDQPTILSSTAFTSLSASDNGYSMVDRFVGDYVLYASDTYYYPPMESQSETVIIPERTYALNLKKFTNNDPVVTMQLPHSIERIDAIGDAAIAIGSKGSDLGMSSVTLGAAPSLEHTQFEINARQGESRSHGFFYKALNPSEGVIGVPILSFKPIEPTSTDEFTTMESIYSIYLQSMSVAYYKVDTAKSFTRLGTLSNTPAVSYIDDCKVSCVDWYGDSRPIFYSGRTFALLGYELVEGAIANNQITENRRALFNPLQR